MSNPVFNLTSTNPFGLSDVSCKSAPAFADIDNDGDRDVFVGDCYGNTLFFRNTGTAGNPAFAAAGTNPFGLGNVGSASSPAFVDIDGDGDLDAFVSEQYGNTLFFRNTGTIGNPVFAAPSTNPFGLLDAGYLATPAFADIDGDGDWDAFMGEGYGNTLFFRNTGTAGNPVFAAPSTNPFGLSDAGFAASPAFADIDSDGDLDAFVGNYDGSTLFYLNHSSGGLLLFSTAGNDILTGTSSLNDTVSYANAAAAVTVSLAMTAQQNTIGAGLDTITTIENLTGGNFNDSLTGNTKNNILNGGAGNDTLNGGAGADTMIGGPGNDTFTVNLAGDIVTENLNEGTDKINSSVTYTLPADVENLTLTGALAINGIGNNLNNKLTGNSAANQLTGGAGNDTLDGKAGIDTMLGGLGNDSYVIDNTGDSVTENSAEGTDKISSKVTYALPVNVENLTLTGTLAIDGTGNDQANKITGNSGNNQLNGAARVTIRSMAGLAPIRSPAGQVRISSNSRPPVMLTRLPILT